MRPPLFSTNKRILRKRSIVCAFDSIADVLRTRTSPDPVSLAGLRDVGVHGRMIARDADVDPSAPDGMRRWAAWAVVLAPDGRSVVTDRLENRARAGLGVVLDWTATNDLAGMIGRDARNGTDRKPNVQSQMTSPVFRRNYAHDSALLHHRWGDDRHHDSSAPVADAAADRTCLLAWRRLLWHPWRA